MAKSNWQLVEGSTWTEFMFRGDVELITPKVFAECLDMGFPYDGLRELRELGFGFCRSRRSFVRLETTSVEVI